MAHMTRSVSYVHDPYNFNAYALAEGYGTCTDTSSPLNSVMNMNACNSSNDSDSDQTSLISARSNSLISCSTMSSHDSRRRQPLVGPCGHGDVRRLRFKKGLGHYLCTGCGMKWKQAHF